MRPPEFTGGNPPIAGIETAKPVAASMRPPEFTGGNDSPWQKFYPEMAELQ